MHKLVVEQKQATIETLSKRADLLEDRLVAKDERIAKYVRLLEERESTATSFSLLSNKALKEKTLSLVSKLRNLNSEYKEMTAEARSFDVSFDRVREIYETASFRWNQVYEQKFKVDAILLREELNARLPKSKRSESDRFRYENPTNPIGLSEVADHLEQLAKLLPDEPLK